jgi:hypothetical protein
MDAIIISVCFVFSKLLRVVYCFVITIAVGGANVQHHCNTYYAVDIKVHWYFLMFIEINPQLYRITVVDFIRKYSEYRISIGNGGTSSH